MSYKIKLGTFKKHENSTAQPNTTGWTELDVVLKNGSEINAPVLTLNIDYNTIVNFNYAVMFDKYYFITSRNMIRSGLCEIGLRVDPMATYKTDIGATNLYILRSSATSDGNIPDNFYATTGAVTRNRQTQPVNTIPVFANGVIVVNLMGSRTNTGTTLVQFTPANFTAFINALYRTIGDFPLDNILKQVVNFFGGNPADLVGGAMWFPYPFEVTGLESIKIGSWDSGVQGGIISNLVMSQSIPEYTYTLNKHPQAASRGAYLNLSPFTRYTLGVPCGGVVELDTTQLIDQTSITLFRKMEAGSGNCITRVVANPSGRVVAYLSGQIGIPININGSNNGAALASGTIATIGSAAAAAFTGGATAIIGAVTAGIGTAATAMQGTAGSSSLGAATIIGESGWLDTTFNGITAEDNTNNGRPLCIVSTPATLGGYMQAYKSTVEINDTIEIQEIIASFIETGFYYE